MENGKAIIGVIIFVIAFIVVGTMIVNNNTAPDDQSKKVVNDIGSNFIFAGAVGLLLLIAIGVIALLKATGAI